MEYRIQELERKEIEEVYGTWLVRHFPEDEVKPLKNILNMWDEGNYMALGMFAAEKDTLLGYAFFAKTSGTRRILLDYYAVPEEYRSKGIGGIFLGEMKKSLKEYQGILIETEDIACAENEEERETRARRNAFYKRSGAVLSELVTEVFGVQYTIWELPAGETVGASGELRLDLMKIYQMMVPGEMFKRYVKI